MTEEGVVVHGCCFLQEIVLGSIKVWRKGAIASAVLKFIIRTGERVCRRKGDGQTYLVVAVTPYLPQQTIAIVPHATTY